MVIRKVLKTFSRKGVVGSSPTLTAIVKKSRETRWLAIQHLTFPYFSYS